MPGLNPDQVHWMPAGGPHRLRTYTVAGLPSDAQAGDLACVTNALIPVALSTVAGGGAVVVAVMYNGTNWIVL